MREIKFRVYDPNNKKMVYGLTLFNTQTIYNKFHNEVHPTELIIEQFTGLLSKNGVEIYEGDILQMPTGIGFVVWADYMYMIESPGSEAQDEIFMAEYNQSEIIGNIHQNPELIT